MPREPRTIHEILHLLTNGLRPEGKELFSYEYREHGVDGEFTIEDPETGQTWSVTVVLEDDGE